MSLSRFICTETLQLAHQIKNCQNCKIVTGTDKFDHITPCLKALKWLPVVKKLYLRDAVMAFKCINGLAPSYLCKKFVKRSLISGRVTRQSNSIQIPKCRTATGQISFHYRAVTIWNSLIESIRLSSSLLRFKRLLKKDPTRNFFRFQLVTSNNSFRIFAFNDQLL